MGFIDYDIKTNKYFIVVEQQQPEAAELLVIVNGTASAYKAKNKLIHYGNFTLNIFLSAAMCDGSMLHIGTFFLTSSHAS
jgi:hypothetical protein